MDRIPTKVSVEQRDRQLRKIAEALLKLADRVEREENSRQLLHQRKGMLANRQNHWARSASGFLMDTLVVGGPRDEKLRLILLSWHDHPNARTACFAHVCDVWQPLYGVPSASAPLACARALRIIANGVWADSDDGPISSDSTDR